MNEIEKYDQFIISLQNEIYENPDMKYRILLRGIKNSECPYLRKKIQGILRK